MIRKIDHTIIVVRNLEQAVAKFKKLLHVAPEDGGFVAELPKFKVAMFPFIGGNRVELIEPKMNVESRFRTFLQERGEGAMAVSIFVDGYEAQVADLKANGFVVEEEVQKDLFPDKPFRMAWVPPSEAHGLWVEFAPIEDLPDFEKP